MSLDSARARVGAGRLPASHHQAGLFPHQIDLPDLDEQLAGEHGEVFTRRWVADLILDLVGYTPDRDLLDSRAIEPSCGSGAFLIPMVQRLIQSAGARDVEVTAEAHTAISAFDLLEANVQRSRELVKRELVHAAVPTSTAEQLAQAWVRRADFLLAPLELGSADFVVGNPPYVRLEAIPQARSLAYRRACETMGGRADVYVGFYERGLRGLRVGGVLGFICADRWMRNAYGAKLRALVSEGWSVDCVIGMTGVDAFADEVDAYPAITIIRRDAQDGGPLAVEATPSFDETGARALIEQWRSTMSNVSGPGFHGARLGGWFSGGGGWPSASPERMALIEDLEERFVPLESEETKTKVGIGVATGADKDFLVADDVDVEPERLLRLALPRDISTGTVVWSGTYLVNPWSDHGLVSIDEWPRMAAYLSGERQKRLAARHTARRGDWHRTIDRVIPGLAERPKLYVPDFKEVLFPVLDEGATYPHHNLYWITSDSWDLRVLGGLLLSDIANMFIAAYSVRMRGGFLRFQAQYLRRIRLPSPDAVGPNEQDELREAFASRDRGRASAVAAELFDIEDLPA